jgi:pyridoxine 4-dehydrogenase
MARRTARPDIHTPAVAAGTISLGRGPIVHRMGFGAMRLTGKGIIGPPKDRAEAIRVLQRAVELGVDFIDTAAAYGPHISEELICEALYPYPEDLVIATKGGFERPGPDQWKTNGQPMNLRADLEGSLRRLKLERIDLWQLHRIDPNVPAEEQFGEMRRFQEEGKIRHAGLSEVSVAEIEAARQIVPIVSVQNLYNVTDRKWEKELIYCEREELAFIPWFPLAAGALEKEAGCLLEEIAQRHAATAYQVALAWLLARSPAMLVIPGTSSVKHLEENVAAAELRLTDKDIAELNRCAPHG